MEVAQITYTIAVVPENATMIDQINQILLGGDYTADVNVPIKDGLEEAAGKAEAITLEMLKKAAKEAKEEHGEEFALSVLEAHDVKVAKTLGRSMSAVDKKSYAAIIEMWKGGPITEPGSDDDDFDDDPEEVTAEAVKDALKSYAKEVGRDEAKEIMTKHGASALSKVADLDQKKLNALMKALGDDL